MTSSEIRKRFIEFFQKRGHAVLPSASLVPENDPSVLFNTAGMQPLVPYLLGKPHPQGTRLVNSQKCVRTVDIDGIGDNTHVTFFEMLGNWSLGDYWKKEVLEWWYEFLTSTEEGLGLNPERLYVTCFEGDDNATRDEESHTIWNEIFIKNNVKGERIYYRNSSTNWWSVGDNGPCGPDSEMFYDLTGELTKGMSLAEYIKADEEQKLVEVGNNVFMQYLKKDGVVVGELPSKNVDTGSGFERVVMAVQGKTNLFDTDLFSDVMTHIVIHSDRESIISERIIADHIRTAVFMITDGVTPSNTDRGYILRRLIRRAVRHADILGLKADKERKLSRLTAIASLFIEKYADVYPNVVTGVSKIYDEIDNEEKKFKKTLEQGLKQFNWFSRESKNGVLGKIELPPSIVFELVTSYGFPIELVEEEAREKGMIINKQQFQNRMDAHRIQSRAGAEQKFKGGLAGTGDIETKYHTATHLLHQALRDVLGDSVTQRGSNITIERLRFDFAFDRKMTDDEKKRVEDTVNEKIKLDLPMNKVTLTKEEAEKTGALHFFGDKYGDSVDVYYIGNSLEDSYSKEFCGGPHVIHTGVLASGSDSEGNPRGNFKFKIIKEEAISAGIRRIKAILEVVL